MRQHRLRRGDLLVTDRLVSRELLARLRAHEAEVMLSQASVQRLGQDRRTQICAAIDEVRDGARLHEFLDEPPASVVVAQQQDWRDLTVKHGQGEQDVPARSSQRLTSEIAIGIDPIKDREPGSGDLDAVVANMFGAAHVHYMYSFPITCRDPVTRGRGESLRHPMLPDSSRFGEGLLDRSDERRTWTSNRRPQRTHLRR